ncbi:MAG: SDR family NAD(P)-dependent oxidoreductase [Christensenellales bacterium]|jgi:NAD(P)-dependent dehydrogenase (short-subunit alcohol dehydrogenase family)
MAFEISLVGKVALVTGGARGIGAEVCRQMAAAGAAVCVNYYHSEADRTAAAALEQEIRQNGGDVLLCEADVSSWPEVEVMFSAIEERFGRLDIVINNAGILFSLPFTELDIKSWRRMMAVILDGAYHVCRGAVPVMLRQGSGSIIMITTNCTVNGGGGSAAYPAAKAGVEGLARQLVVEYAGRGIRTNIIRPAVIDTDMFRQRYPTDEDVLAYGRKMPVGRVGKPIDIANAVVFLRSDKASYICGQALQVDGGRTFYYR